MKRLEGEKREPGEEEKATLARYAGWGALSSAFDGNPPSEFRRAASDLREILTDAEYESARASTPNAHFTSPLVIGAMWEAMQQLGLKAGSQILEPSMGVGHFLGMMPDALMRGSRRAGVELDAVTARIARRLYPDSTIFAKGFEETPLPNDYFDAVIGNVPFGNYAVHDPSYPRQLTAAIHDYFFAKSLDKLRPGGVMALITSRYTMDKQDAKVRTHLAEGADLIGAIRLPNTAFKANAGTEVTTDIIFLRKRKPGQSKGGEAWLSLASMDSEDGPVEVNEYYARNPSMMLGKMKFEGTMYRGGEPVLTGPLTAELLKDAVRMLPQGVYIPRDDARPPPLAPLADAETFSGVKDGAFAERDGQLFIRNGHSFEPANISASSATRVRGMMLVRDAVRKVFKTQLDDAPEHDIVEARWFLNRAYDSFVHRHGPISSRENLRAFAGDPDQPLLLSLEIYDAETKSATKAAIFERRTLERSKPADHVETAAEALAISLNETVGVSWPRMTQLTGRTPAQMQRELGHLVYRNPNGGEWETADRYLSGDVRVKLKAAQSAAELDPAYARNVEALKCVQPEDLQPGEISARLGSPWIPASDVRDFIAQLLGTPSHNVTVKHSGAIATWTVTLDGFVRASASNIATHGTPRVRAGELIEDALNGRTPTVYDLLPDDKRVINQQETLAAREKQQQLKEKFSEWVWADPDRAVRLARVYNDTFNNLRLRVFDGSHLTFPGMNRSVLRDGDLAKHQKDAVWRCLQSDSTLLAHVVGAGKTYVMAAAAMEMRRLGLAAKPMIVVSQSSGGAVGSGVPDALPAGQYLRRGQGAFHEGRPRARDVAHRHRQLRRRYRLAPLL